MNQPILNIKNAFSKRKYKKELFIAAIIALAALLLLLSKSIFFVLMFVVANIILSLLLFPFRQVLFGIDLTMLASVLCGTAFGWKAGLLAAVLSSASKLIAQQNFSVYSLMVVPSYMVIGIASGLVGSSAAINTNNPNIFAIGIAAIIFHSLVTSFVSFFAFGGSIGKILVFLATNVPFNIFLFYYFAPALMKIMV